MAQAVYSRLTVGAHNARARAQLGRETALLPTPPLFSPVLAKEAEGVPR